MCMLNDLLVRTALTTFLLLHTYLRRILIFKHFNNANRIQVNPMCTAFVFNSGSNSIADFLATGQPMETAGKLDEICQKITSNIKYLKIRKRGRPR